MGGNECVDESICEGVRVGRLLFSVLATSERNVIVWACVDVVVMHLLKMSPCMLTLINRKKSEGLPCWLRH